MDGARDQLLPRAGFSSDQHRRVCSRNFGHPGQYLLYGRRGANDFLEHRHLFNLFAQNQVLSLGSVFCPFTIVNVDSCTAPANNSFLFVAQRVDLVEKPTVLTVCFTHARFHGEYLSARHRIGYPCPEFLQIVGVRDQLEKVQRGHGRNRTKVLERRPVTVGRACIRFPNKHVHGSNIDDLLQLPGVLCQGLVGAFQVFNVGVGTVPADNLPLLIAYRQGAGLKPAIDPVRTSHPLFDLIHFPGRACQFPLLRDSCGIFRMKSVLPVVIRRLFDGNA